MLPEQKRASDWNNLVKQFKNSNCISCGEKLELDNQQFTFPVIKCPKNHNGTWAYYEKDDVNLGIRVINIIIDSYHFYLSKSDYSLTVQDKNGKRCIPITFLPSIKTSKEEYLDLIKSILIFS